MCQVAKCNQRWGGGMGDTEEWERDNACVHKMG
jgi:hypothetical protein